MQVTPQDRVRNTIAHLKLCQRARAAGYQVATVQDPEWLVDVAINRRAGWPDDPSFARGSAMPVNGIYPKRASGDYYRHLRLVAHEVNTPRLTVREARLGELREFFRKKLPRRITWCGEED